MILAVIAALSIGIFTVGLFALGIVKAGRDALTVSNDAFGVMKDEGLTDEEREKLVQKASLKLAGACVSIAARFAAALVLAFVPIGIFHLTGIVSMEESFRYLSRWDVIVVSSIIVTIGFFAWHRLKTSH